MFNKSSLSSCTSGLEPAFFCLTVVDVFSAAPMLGGADAELTVGEDEVAPVAMAGGEVTRLLFPVRDEVSVPVAIGGAVGDTPPL